MTQLLHRADDDAAPKAPPTEDEQKAALQRLLVVIGGAIALTVATGTWKVAAVIVAVMAMIMLHEFGHFIMAKRAGMKVTEFFLGFGPRLWSVRKGDTEYGVKAIVLAGGYVRIVGMSNLEDVDPDDEPRTYRAGSFPKRLSVVVAGSVTHFLLALLLLYVLHTIVGMQRLEPSGAEVRQIVRVDAATPSPAEQAGLRVGDRIVAADGREVTESQLTAYIRTRMDQDIELDVVRDGEALRLTVHPVDGSTLLVKGKPIVKDHVGFVGVSVQRPLRVERTDPITGVARAVGDVGRITALSAGGLVDLFSFNGIDNYGDQLTGNVPENVDPEDQPRLLSPVGLVRVASAAADSGIRPVLFLLVAINIFVGMFNMLPLLPFDGGHVAVAIYERIRSRGGRRYYVDFAKLMPVTYAVVMLLVFLAVTALYLDITQPLEF